MRALPGPVRYGALPRAINLGRARQVGMPRLRELLTLLQGTPLASWTWDTLLGVPATARNWTTVGTAAGTAATEPTPKE